MALNSPVFDDFVDEFALNVAKTIQFFNDKMNNVVDQSMVINSEGSLSGCGKFAFHPKMDLHEDVTTHSYHMFLDLPGIKKQDISINISPDNILSVLGERHVTNVNMIKKDKFYKRERSYGKYCRYVKLPNDVDVDSVNAAMENGVLHITLKKGSVNSGKKIVIN